MRLHVVSGAKWRQLLGEEISRDWRSEFLLQGLMDSVLWRKHDPAPFRLCPFL